MHPAHLFDLRHLRAFVAVAEGGGVARAAEQVARSQPAITRQLQDLETVLGVALFDRRGRSLRLTEEGRALLEDARRLLDGAERLAQRADAAAAGKIGRLAVGFGGAAINGPLGPLVADFQRRHPSVALHLVERFDDAELTAMVASGELDVAVVRFPADDPGLRRTVVGRQAYRAVLPAGHPLADRDRIPLAALAGEPFILWPRASATAAWDAVFASCVAAGFVPTVHQQTLSVSALLALVAAGLGVTLLAEGYTALKRDGVRYVALADGPIAPMELVTRADEAGPPVLAAFRELVIRRFA